MPHWNLANIGALNDLEMETFEYVVKQAADAYAEAMHDQEMSGLTTDEERAEAELEAMRHALQHAAPGFVTAALIHAAVYRSDELKLTPEQRVKLQEVAGVLQPEVWARLTGTGPL